MSTPAQTLQALREGIARIEAQRAADPAIYGRPGAALAYLAGWMQTDDPELSAAFERLAHDAGAS